MDASESCETGGIEVLEGARVTLEPLEGGDAPRLGSMLAADPEAAAWWGSDATKIARWLTEPGAFAYRIVVNGDDAGVIEFSEETEPEYRYASIDIALISPFTDRGLGPDALRTLLEYLFTHRGHHRAHIDPAAANERAIRAYEKVGFRPVGVLRRYERTEEGIWRDGLLMDILAEELTAGT